MYTSAEANSETISDLLARQAAGAPEVPALFAPERAPLSYGALHTLAESTRGALRALGVARQDRVAIVLANGPEMATSFVTVASAAVCAPLNPAYVPSEFEFYLKDLAPKLVLVREGAESPVRAVAEALGIRVAQLRAEAGSAAGAFTLDAPEAGGVVDHSSPDDTALILHTSGTTSRPKMVPLSQRNLCVSAHSIARSFALTPEDRCLNVMPLFHIHGLIGAVLSSLDAGASVVCTPGFSSARFFAWLDEFSPTWYTAVPTMHQEILARAEAHREIVARRPLRFIRSCSASLAPTLLHTLEAVFQAPALESYGMTEAAHQMASNPLPPRARKPGSVGVASGPEVAIMDGAGALLDAGATGEIVIRGPNVTSGYLGVPEANREAFTNGWFRTGDQGYLDAEGYLFLTGRLKEIINRGGEKISPREIDEAMLEHPSVAQAVAFAVPHSRLGEEVGAAVVRKPGASLDEGELREFVAARLSVFKVPRVIRFVDAVPKGPTGKLQRIGLAARLGIDAIDESKQQASAEFVAPRTPLEERLAAIWREMLRADRVGVDDHFFTIGGDSLAAVQLVARVSQEFAVEVANVRFLETPTIATMAREIEAARSRSPRHPHLVVIRPEGTRPPLFCAAGHDENVVGFGTLGRYLPSDLPVMAFAPLEPEEVATTRTIQAQAARNVAAMRDAQPHGPYFLLGLCHGGLVAYEMACQLEQCGERVALLALLDAYPGGWKSHLSAQTRVMESLRHGARRIQTHLGAIFGAGGWKHLRERLSLFRAAWTEKAAATAGRVGLSQDGHDARMANREAQRNYAASPYSGAAILFRSTTPRPGIYPLAAGAWRPLVQGGFEIVDVGNGFGNTLTEPGVQVVAMELTKRLQIVASSTLVQSST